MRAGITVALVAFATACASNDEPRTPVATAGALEIYDAYAPSSPAPDLGSLYFSVVNQGVHEDTLVGVTTSVSGRSEVHNMIEVNGVSQMSEVRVIPIPGRSRVTLKPGSYHVMLRELDGPVRVGDTVRVDATFSGAGTVSFRAPVMTYTEVVRALEAAEEAEDLR